MSKTVDLSPFIAALDAREWRLVSGYEDDVAAALETVVKLGASEDELKRVLRQYVADDNLIKRLLPAARHLARQGAA